MSSNLGSRIAGVFETSQERRTSKSDVRLWLGMLLALVALAGCQDVAQWAGDVAAAAEVQGTWEFKSMRGGTPEERETERRLSGRLVLSSSLTFTYESADAGNKSRRASGHGRWYVKDGVVKLLYEEKNGQPFSGLARFEIAGDELILRPDDEDFVFVFLRTQ